MFSTAPKMFCGSVTATRLSGPLSTAGLKRSRRIFCKSTIPIFSGSITCRVTGMVFNKGNLTSAIHLQALQILELQIASGKSPCTVSHIVVGKEIPHSAIVKLGQTLEFHKCHLLIVPFTLRRRTQILFMKFYSRRYRTECQEQNELVGPLGFEPRICRL